VYVVGRQGINAVLVEPAAAAGELIAQVVEMGNAPAE
jgi:hypothetical protein